ncbi:MAG: DUF4157 domain-containing protein [Chitinophagales bacterium]
MSPQNISQHKENEQKQSSKKKDFLSEQSAMPFIQAKKGGAGSFFSSNTKQAFFSPAPTIQNKSNNNRVNAVPAPVFPNIPIIQHQQPTKEEETAQKKEGEEASQEGLQMKTASSGGDLPTEVQTKMENAFGQDFSNVNIHKESKNATDVGALAYAQGNDVHFAPGQFKPNTQAGQELIGHELTHVVQQREGRVKPTTQAKGLAVNDDKGLEKEADDMGKMAAQGKVVQKKSTSKANINNSLVIQGSFISFALKMGAKKASKGMLKNFIKTKIRGKINRIAIKKYSKQFAKEADDLIGVLDDAWWETAIGFIPVFGDAFDLVNVPRKLKKAIDKADKLEKKAQHILKIQHLKAAKIIPEKFKQVKNYPQNLENFTYAEIIQKATKGNKGAQTLKKLIEQQDRLFQKLK